MLYTVCDMVHDISGEMYSMLYRVSNRYMLDTICSIQCAIYKISCIKYQIQFVIHIATEYDMLRISND